MILGMGRDAGNVDDAATLRAATQLATLLRARAYREGDRALVLITEAARYAVDYAAARNRADGRGARAVLDDLVRVIHLAGLEARRPETGPPRQGDLPF